MTKQIKIILDGPTDAQLDRVIAGLTKLGIVHHVVGRAKKPTDSTTGRPAKYPWRTLSPGQTVAHAVSEKDLNSARVSARNFAKRSGWRVSTAYRDGMLYVTREA